MPVQTISIGRFIDSRGTLTYFQFPEHLPFPPARVFAVSGVPDDAVRGQHAHKTNEQFLLCVSGSLSTRFHNGKDWEEHKLSADSFGIIVPPMHFGELSKFHKGTVLLVATSEPYDEGQYINDFEKFLNNF